MILRGICYIIAALYKAILKQQQNHFIRWFFLYSPRLLLAGKLPLAAIYPLHLRWLRCLKEPFS